MSNPHPTPGHAQPKAPAVPRLSLSGPGRGQRIHHEGIIRHYYNDSVNNCTYGVGTLAHRGPCTVPELHTHVSDGQRARSMMAGIHRAEIAVRHAVTHQNLNQRQFDSLVSYTYNRGAGGAHPVLRLVNAGHFGAAAQNMGRAIRATVMGPNRKPLLDKNGHHVTRVLPGLITRRAAESAPFRVHAAPAHNTHNQGGGVRG